MENKSNPQQLPILSFILVNNGQGANSVNRALESISKQDYPSKICIIVNTRDQGDKDDIKLLMDNLERSDAAPLAKPNEVWKGKVCGGKLNVGLVSFADYIGSNEARLCGIQASYGYSHVWAFLDSNEEYVCEELSSLAMSKIILQPSIIGLVYADLIKEKNNAGTEHRLNENNSAYYLTKLCFDNLSPKGQLPDLSNNYNVGAMLSSHLPVIGIKQYEKLRPARRSSPTTTAH